MIESTLYLLCLGLLGEIRAQGGWVGLAHPADPGRHVASFFRSVEVRLRQFCNVFGMSYAEVDQCNFRAVHRKPLGLLLPTPCAMKHVKRIHGRKNHSRRSPILHDRSDGGGSPKYPSGLCHALATKLCGARCVGEDQRLLEAFQTRRSSAGFWDQRSLAWAASCSVAMG